MIDLVLGMCPPFTMDSGTSIPPEKSAVSIRKFLSGEGSNDVIPKVSSMEFTSLELLS